MPDFRKHFQGFPTIRYSVDGGIEHTILQDFLKNLNIRESIKQNPSAWSRWIIRDEDTIYTIAHRLYGSTDLYWVISMLNNMLNPAWDWPMTDIELMNYVDKKYGVGHGNDLHHLVAAGPQTGNDLYDLPTGTIVDEYYEVELPTPRDIVEVTNFDYESTKNEENREIRLLRPEYWSVIHQEKASIIKSNFVTVKRR